MPMTEKRFVVPGEKVRLELPYSEVCMHMQVAGKVRDVEFRGTCAQIFDDDGREYSAPISPGEAGFMCEESGGYYCYPDWRRPA
jgi:hypothetical protein